jgi:hypothetical protein
MGYKLKFAGEGICVAGALQSCWDLENTLYAKGMLRCYSLEHVA